MIKKLCSAFLTAILVVLLGVLLGAASPADQVEAARLNNIGVAYMNQQLFEKALKTFNEAAAKDPGMKVVALNRGVALMNLQKGEEAKDLLEKASKDDPNDPHSFYSLGLYYKNSSEPEKAIAAFRRVTEIDPNDADTWYFLGSTYAQLKQFPEAIAGFEHALKLDPLHASAQFGLARAYQQSGQSDSAHEAMKKFQYVTQNKLGAPISLVYGEQGKYSRAEESPVAVAKVLPQIPVKFVDVTKEAGIVSRPRPITDFPGYPQNLAKPYVPSSGACFIDYDNEGKIDIFVPDNGSQGGMSLYHNLGNGTFDDVTKQAGLNPEIRGRGCTVGDYDNDGFPDLAVSGDFIYLFHNEKNGKFAEVAGDPSIVGNRPPAGIVSRNEGMAPSRWLAVNFIDYDHDGDLDLFVTRALAATSRASDHEYEADSYEPGQMWRNNGNGTFTEVTGSTVDFRTITINGIGTDYNNDRAIDLVVTGSGGGATVFENQREGPFLAKQPWSSRIFATVGVAALDFDHDGWMDLAFSHFGVPAVTLWHNNHAKSFDRVSLPEVSWTRADGIVALDYDNDGWVDLAAVGETKDGKGEVRLFRNLGPDGWKDVTADVGLDKIQLKEPRAIIAGDYDNDGAVDLLITQNHGPAVLLRNEGGNKNNSLRLALKGLNDNKSAIGTKVEVFSTGLRQKFEVYGSSGYLGQNSPYLTIGLGQAKQADVVRMLWPTGVLQDEIEVAANKVQNILEIDRRGSSCPTLFAWDGTHYELVGDMLGAGVVGHWVGPPQGLKPQFSHASIGTAEAVPFPVARSAEDGEGTKFVSGQRFSDAEGRTQMAASLGAGTEVGERNIARPVEYIKIKRDSLRVKEGPDPVDKSRGPSSLDAARDFGARLRRRASASTSTPQGESLRASPCSAQDDKCVGSRGGMLSFRFMEPLEESVYLDSVELLAVDHPMDLDVYPNEYFASNPPYPPFKVVFSNNAKPPAGAWDEHGHDVLPDLLAHRYFGDFKVLSFQGFTEPHTLELDLGEPYRGGPLWLLMHGEIEYFSATSMYAADQAHLTPFAPYVEAQDEKGKWVRVVDDLGFPAGGARTMTADLSGKLPVGTRRIRMTTNLQIYWDNILISRTDQRQSARVTPVPLARADLSFHGFPLKIEDKPPGNVKYIYEKVSVTGPYTRPAGAYTRYGDVRALLTKDDDKFAVFGSGDEVALDFDPAKLPPLPHGWVRDYFFAAHGYEKDMDFYAYHGDTVEPLPYHDMGTYPYPGKSFPNDPDHFNYQLEYNSRFMSGKEATGYSFQYPKD